MGARHNGTPKIRASNKRRVSESPFDNTVIKNPPGKKKKVRREDSSHAEGHGFKQQQLPITVGHNPQEDTKGDTFTL